MNARQIVFYGFCSLVFFLILGVGINSLELPTSAHAQAHANAHEARQTKALESIAKSLEKIERKLK